MYALAPLAFFLATVAAAPQPGSQLIPRDTLAAMTVAEAQGSCGSYQQVSCCGKSESGSNPSSPGLIGGLLNSLLKGGIFGQCSPLEVSVIGLGGLLSNNCKGSVACCDHSTGGGGGGFTLINLELPCIALGSLL